MTPRQQRFVAEFCIDRNGAAAARRAGYAPRAARQTANYLLTNPYISTEIKRRGEAVAKKLSVDHESVVEGLIVAYEEARKQRLPMAMIAAMREIGTCCGLYPERGSRRDRLPHGNSPKEMTDEEILALLEDDDTEPANQQPVP